MKTLERQFEHEAELLAFEAEAIYDRQEALKNPTQALKRRLSNIKKNIQPRLVDKIITDLYDKLYVPANLFAEASGHTRIVHGNWTTWRAGVE
jgi:hypothetical protein